MTALRRIGLVGIASALMFVFAGGGGVSRAGPPSEGASQGYPPAALEIRKPQGTSVACAAPGGSSGVAGPSYAAVVRHVAAAYAQPGGRLLEHFERMDENGYRTVLGVLGARTGSDCRPTWYRVQLPVPPNGSSGWVAATAVRVYPVETRVIVRLSMRRLVVYRYGRPVFRARVAVGTALTPTPVGRYFVNERFLLKDPTGPFGVAALGISAHSDVLKNWRQGGPIALHGTDEPTSIGRAATHGCIRLSNEDMRRLFALVPAGTPVLIRG